MLDVVDTQYDDTRKEIIRYLRKNSLKVCCDKKTPKRDKLAYCCLMLGYPIYKLSWSVFIHHQRG